MSATPVTFQGLNSHTQLAFITSGSTEIEPFYYPETSTGKHCSRSLNSLLSHVGLRSISRNSCVWCEAGTKLLFSEWISNYPTSLSWSHHPSFKSFSGGTFVLSQVASHVKSVRRLSSVPMALVQRPHSLDYWNFSMSLLSQTLTPASLRAYPLHSCYVKLPRKTEFF